MYHFVNNIWSHFTNTIQVFYGELMDQKHVTVLICRFFLPNLDIIVIIML